MEQDNGVKAAHPTKKKKTRRGKKKTYRNYSFNLTCMDMNASDIDFSEYRENCPKVQRHTASLRPDSLRAPQNSTSFIMENHIEGVEIDLTLHTEDDLPLYLANASWTQCNTPPTMEQIRYTNEDMENTSFYEDTCKYSSNAQAYSPAYHEADAEPKPSEYLHHRFSYMCKDFEAQFWRERVSQLSELSKDELIHGIKRMHDKVDDLEKKINMKRPRSETYETHGARSNNKE